MIGVGNPVYRCTHMEGLKLLIISNLPFTAVRDQRFIVNQWICSKGAFGMELKEDSAA